MPHVGKICRLRKASTGINRPGAKTQSRKVKEKRLKPPRKEIVLFIAKTFFASLRLAASAVYPLAPRRYIPKALRSRTRSLTSNAPLLTNKLATTRFASLMSTNLVTQHFFAPLNVGEIENPEGVGGAASVNCGAVVRVSLRVDESQRIMAAKFKVAGCSYLVAVCSVLSTAMIGKTTGEAAVLCQPSPALLSLLGEDWPVDKGDCLALASRGFVAAISNYSDAVREEWSGAEALICTCFGVSENTIEAAIQTGGLRTIAEVTKASNAGAGCRSCYPLIEDILDQCARENDVVPDSRG